MQSIPIYIVTIALFLMQGRAGHTIIGKWEAVEANDGFRVTMEFGRGGVFYQTAGIYRSGTYRLDGSRILVEEPALNNAAEAAEFRIDGDELVLKFEDGELRLPRIGRQTSNAPAIVGKWGEKGAYFHGGDNGFASFEFTQDGRFIFRMQAEPEKGRYQTRGNLLTTRMHGESSASSIRFEDGFLILKSRSKPPHEEKYKRIE